MFETEKLLTGRSTLHSNRLPDADLFIATRQATAVIIGKRVYVCGGICPSVVLARRVQVYDQDIRTWTILPPAPQFNSEAAAIKNQLVLLGGREASSSAITNLVSTWSGRGWQQDLPLMPTKRFRPSVTTFECFVIVAGGRAEDNQTPLSTIDVLNTTTQQWFTLPHLQLPWPMYGMKIIMCTESIYVGSACIGYNTTTNSDTSTRSVWQLPVHVLKTVLANMSNVPNRRWIEVTSTPNYGSAFLQGTAHLVAVGGYDESWKPTADIVVYDPGYDKWSRVGKLRVATITCSVVSLDKSSILVLGGRTDPTDSKTLLSSVELVYVQ